MIILTLRTDKPQSELGLFQDEVQLRHEVWEAHRELAETIHLKLESLLRAAEHDLHDIGGIVAYQGPGSFTGLRIGLSVVNALAYALQIPVAATTGDDWVQRGLSRLKDGQGTTIALPVYGAPVHITSPKH